MRNFLVLLLMVIPAWANASRVLPECDIVFYKNDTLYLEKLFESVILGKIAKQPDFKANSSPLEANSYKAYWKIEDDKIFLIKVSNCRSDFCFSLKDSDTLDLQKAFGEEYQNGQVAFNLENKAIRMHKRFKIRNYWTWFPTYLEDYNLQFKSNALLKADTTTNYLDEKDKLNRYSLFQLESELYPVLLESIEVGSKMGNYKKIQFLLTVQVNQNGNVDTLEISNIHLTDFSDSIIELDTPADYILIEKTYHALKNITWDEIKVFNKDQASFIFEYFTDTKKVSSHHFNQYLDHAKIYETENMPWFIKLVYENSLSNK